MKKVNFWHSLEGRFIGVMGLLAYCLASFCFICYRFG